jgi:hypothetical protein
MQDPEESEIQSQETAAAQCVRLPGSLPGRERLRHAELHAEL